MTTPNSTIDLFQRTIEADIERYEKTISDFDLFDNHISGVSGALEYYPQYLVNQEVVAFLIDLDDNGFNDNEKLELLREKIIKKVSRWSLPASSNQVQNTLSTIEHSEWTKLIPILGI